MVISFPAELEEAIMEASRAVPGSKLLSASAALSKHYRESLAGGHTPEVQGELAALSYATIIMPAAYAQLYGAMQAVRERLPGWQPRNLLDIGSGPGTALWAAVAHWPGLAAMTAWEREPAFIALGRQLARAGRHPALQKADWRQVHLRPGFFPAGEERFELVALGHALNEMDPELRKTVARQAWERCAGLLLIVEPGTSAAFPQVRELREYLLGLGARTIAPCVHDQPCPLENDWCHFPQKINRPSFQRRAKGGTAGWEESKFSYVALARFGPESPAWGRLLHQPDVQKGFVELTVSSREGIVHPRALKRHREDFNRLSKLDWGDLLKEKPQDGEPETEK